MAVLGKRRRLTEESKDEVQLLLDCGAREEGPPCGHLVVNAAHAPAGSKGQGRVRLGLLAPTLPRAAPLQRPAPQRLRQVLAWGSRTAGAPSTAKPPPLKPLSGGVSEL